MAFSEEKHLYYVYWAPWLGLNTTLRNPCLVSSPSSQALVAPSEQILTRLPRGDRERHKQTLHHTRHIWEIQSLPMDYYLSPSFPSADSPTCSTNFIDFHREQSIQAQTNLESLTKTRESCLRRVYSPYKLITFDKLCLTSSFRALRGFINVFRRSSLYVLA